MNYLSSAYVRTRPDLGLGLMGNLADTFAANLNYWLQAQGRKQIWLAEQLEVSPSAIVRWKSGQSLPQSDELLQKIAELIGVHPAMLFVQDGVKDTIKAAESLVVAAKSRA